MKRNVIVFFLLVFIFNHLTAKAQLPNYVPADGLVGWWPFTGNANDSSGMNNNGNALNVSLTTDRFGISNAAYLFNGSNGRIDVADVPSLRVRKITMSAWVLCNNTSPFNQVIYKGTINAEGESYSLNVGSQSVATSLKINSNCISGSGWSGGLCSESPSAGAWEHYVVTYDSSSLRFYKNGELDTSYALYGLIDNCVGGPLRFGFNHLRFSSSTGDPFNGKIDDIGIWNRALGDSEIRQLYNASLGGTDCGNSGNVGINICEPQRSLHVKDVIRLEPRITAPANPVRGDLYYDGTLNKLRVFDGTVWQNCW